MTDFAETDILVKSMKLHSREAALIEGAAREADFWIARY